MRNLLSPELYEKLCAASRKDNTIRRLLYEWDSLGSGSLLDYTVRMVIQLSMENAELKERLISNLNHTINSPILLDGKPVSQFKRL